MLHFASFVIMLHKIV